MCSDLTLQGRPFFIQSSSDPLIPSIPYLLRTSSDPKGKRRWANATITDILSNEKYAGDSVYGKTVLAEYPAMKRVKNDTDQVPRSENHHPAIIEKAYFERVQEMRRLRTNVEIDEHGNKVRKDTHYSIKRPLDVMEEQAGPEET